MPGLRQKLSIGSRAYNMKKLDVAVLLVLVVGIGLIVGVANYGLWQTNGVMVKAGTSGLSYVNSGSVITTTVTPGNPTTVTIQSNNYETKPVYNTNSLINRGQYVSVPSGPAPVQINIGSIYHVNPTGLVMASGIPQYQQISNDTQPYRVIIIQDPSNPKVVWYFSEYLYAIDVDFRTLAQIKEDDTTNYNMHIHEGQVAGSFGTDVSAYAYLQLTVDPDWIYKVIPTSKVVHSGSTTLNYTSSFIGIMNAWYADTILNRGYISTPPTVKGVDASGIGDVFYSGHVNGAPTPGAALALLSGSMTGGYSAISSLGFHKPSDFPTSVTVQVTSGNMLAGGYFIYVDWGGFLLTKNVQRSSIQAYDVHSKATIILDVLAAAGYTIYSGNPPALGDNTDFNPQRTHPYALGLPWWAMLLIFVAVVLVLWKVLPAYLSKGSGKR